MTKTELRVYIRKTMMEYINNQDIMNYISTKALGEKIVPLIDAGYSHCAEVFHELEKTCKTNTAAIEKWKKAAVSIIYSDVCSKNITDIPAYIEDCIRDISEEATFSRRWNRYFWDRDFLKPEVKRSEYDNTTWSPEDFVFI